jgi:hypothetical protein
MKIIAVVLVLALSGCAGLPSFDACDTFAYQRTREAVSIDCKLRPASVTLPSIPGL